MTEAERLLPRYLQALERAGLGDVDVIIRMAGCPNSCSRPPTAEIGIYGYGKNDYVLQVGGSRHGTRVGRAASPGAGDPRCQPRSSAGRRLPCRHPGRGAAGLDRAVIPRAPPAYRVRA